MSMFSFPSQNIHFCILFIYSQEIQRTRQNGATVLKHACFTLYLQLYWTQHNDPEPARLTRRSLFTFECAPSTNSDGGAQWVKVNRKFHFWCFPPQTVLSLFCFSVDFKSTHFQLSNSQRMSGNFDEIKNKFFPWWNPFKARRERGMHVSP